jgi:glycosyltransferase involved in cell wall biosynthesis
MFLSVIIPVYNEENTIIQILKKVNEQKKNQSLEIIISDDGSNDKTLGLLKKNHHLYEKLVSHKINMGKGHAIKKALNLVEGDIVLIQDADLEYDPEDYLKLLEPIKNKVTNVVYGSRVLQYNNRYSATKSFTSILRIFGNHMLTMISNTINEQNLTDAHTCYKVFKIEILKKFDLKQNDFSFCPELTTKISLAGEKIIEVPISYKGRPFSEGKKIGLKDAFLAFYTIIKFRFFR